VADALARLADRPWSLLIVLFAINTATHPYVGITSDARLYSGQVLNRVEGGSYADDIFFQYGSQDEYSLFSLLAAPFVRLLGLPTAFFLIYLVSKTLLIFGMMRITRTLVPSPVAGVLALFYCMVHLIGYGGNNVLYVQENILTPRLLSCAFVLIGLDLMLRGRPFLATAAILFAIGNHPLMGFGGLLVLLGYQLWHWLGARAFTGAVAASVVLVTVVLAIEPLGKRCFGEMDDAWRDAIFGASPFNFASSWERANWRSLAIQLAIVGIAIWRLRAGSETGATVARTRFLTVLIVVSVAGAVGTIAAEQLPYALFFQGQPYRVLWLAAFLHIPLVFWLCGEAFAQPGWVGQTAGCVLLALLCFIDGLREEMALPLLLFPVAAVVFRGLDKTPNHPGWLVQSVQVSLVLAALLWGAYKFVLLVRGAGAIAIMNPELRDIGEIILRSFGPIVCCVGATALVVVWARRGWRPAFGIGLAAVAIGVQTLWFALPRTDFYREECTQYRGDLKRVHALLHRDGDPARPLPTVYCNLGCLDYVWLDLRAKSYLDWWQAGNYMFRREMALEGQRRARLVGPFEIARYRRYGEQLTPGFRSLIARFFDTDFDHPPLSRDDVARLCAEPGLDYLVLDQAVDGVDSVQVGRLHVFSCREVRTALSGSAQVASVTSGQ
jgi:hypothetical protein